MAKVKAIKEVKIKAPKIRNNATMTESAFWGWIRQVLRRASMYWKPIAQTRVNARRKYHGPNRRQKWEYQCVKCKNWFMGDEISVDHKNECGSLSSADDLPGFVSRLFCEVEDLQILCKEHHDKKTLEYKQSKIK